MNSWLILRWRRMIFNHCSKRYYWPFEWFSKSSSRTAFSLLPGGLGHFAGGNSFPLSLTTSFHPVLTVAILLTYLPLLVGRLFQRDVICLGSMRCWRAVLPWQNLTCFPKFHRVVRISQLSILATAPRILISFFSISCAWFCFARIRLNPLSGKILYHDSVPVIVSTFSSLIEDFVICSLSSHQTFLLAVELRQCVFCKRLFRYFGSQADVPISCLLGSE